jgi:hypothetical protein
MITPEEIYTYYHKATNEYRGIHVRPIKNFEKIYQSPRWKTFQACAHLINRNAGFLNYKILIDALVASYKGKVDVSALVSLKGIKIYKNYVSALEKQSNPSYIKSTLSSSVNFVVKYCKERNITCFDDYIYDGIYLIPTFVKHYTAGSISAYFLSAIENFNIIYKGLPNDVKESYLEEFEKEYSVCRSRLLANDETAKYVNKIGLVVDRLLKQGVISNGISKDK